MVLSSAFASSYIMAATTAAPPAAPAVASLEKVRVESDTSMGRSYSKKIEREEGIGEKRKVLAAVRLAKPVDAPSARERRAPAASVRVFACGAENLRAGTAPGLCAARPVSSRWRFPFVVIGTMCLRGGSRCRNMAGCGP